MKRRLNTKSKSPEVLPYLLDCCFILITYDLLQILFHVALERFISFLTEAEIIR